MRFQSRASVFALAAALVVAGCANENGDQTTQAAATITNDSLAALGSAGAEWLSYGGTYDEQRHSRLTQVNTGNVGNLGVAWTYDLNSNRGIEATPLIHNGVMYVTSSWSILHAVDARTGKELWVYDPGVDKAVGVYACCDVVNRGVALKDGVLFLGVIDGRLEAVDAKTGKKLWSTQTVDRSKPYTITGAPRVVRNMVLIGNGGAELGVRGYISAYDTKSGEMIWRFYTTPNPDGRPDNAASDGIMAKLAGATWGKSGRWKIDGGGGTVWDSIVYDDVNDQILFGVGNGSPWNAQLRDPEGNGDNLFISSVVAVDANTGEYRWHYQTTPRDNWDYTATQTIILADLPVGENGTVRRVAMQAPKNGFFYVLDAKTGQFISGKNFVPQNWTTGLDANGRPIETADARPTNSSKIITPGAQGAHNWHPMAFSPALNLAFIPAQELPQGYDPITQPDKGTKWNTGFKFEDGATPDPLSTDMLKAVRASMKGRLIAWDPIKQQARWTVELPTPSNGGVLSTAGGLVFQGTVGGDFVAYATKDGKKLWSQNVKGGIMAAPVTYELDGEQYVAIASGWGGAYALATGLNFDKAINTGNLGRVIAFKLGAKGSVPDHDLIEIEKVPQTAKFGDAATIKRGLIAYSRNCAVCHGPMAISSGVLPDLRWSVTSGDAGMWRDVVIGGQRSMNGMVSFSKQLSDADSEAIRAYIVHQAHDAPDLKLSGERK